MPSQSRRFAVPALPKGERDLPHWGRWQPIGLPERAIIVGNALGAHDTILRNDTIILLLILLSWRGEKGSRFTVTAKNNEKIWLAHCAIV